MVVSDEHAKAPGQFVPLEQVYRLVEQHRGAGRLDDAENLIRQVLGAHPSEPQAHHYLGLVAHQRGQLGAAVQHVTRATELAPTVALFHANLGEMHRLAGHLDLAIRHGERAVELKPNYPEAVSNIGIAHYERKDYEKALASQRHAIALNPEFGKAHSNCGNALHGLRRFDEAVECYRRALELLPEFADAWANLGTSLHHCGAIDEAIVALRRALALDPDHANAHAGLGILQLMRGDMAEGWAEYEWRLKSTEVRLPYHPQRPWQGESLEGRHIYIHAEQGFGDTMQFARYVPLVAARAGAVTFRVQQGLAGLMRQSMPGVDVLGDGGTVASISDYECALMSLPHILGTRLETIPASVPYLRADDREAGYWRERFAKLPGLKAGLIWGGNPEHINDARRSIALGALAPLFAVPGVSFVSLQIGPPAADIPQHPEFAILDVASELVPFSATAAAMAALDLVITIDSSCAHLAGAMAKPTWLLTSWLADWRWFLNREDSPWYPTMRLFRQAKDEPWSPVAARMAGELARAAQGDGSVLTPFRAAGEKRAASAAGIIQAREKRRVAPPALAQPAAQILALAEQRRQFGKLAEAETLARHVLNAEPDNAAAFHLLGIIAHQAGNLAHALEHLKRAAALAPAVALYHANLGEMYRLAGRTDEAIASGERALAIKPDYPDALSNLGIAYYEHGAFEKAIDCYERAIALNPNFAQAISNLGNALRAVKHFDDALPCYRRAIELQPEFADAWTNLGTTLRDLKKAEEAEGAYRKALAFTPDAPEAINNLALCVQDLHHLDEAEELLRRSLAIEDRNAKTLLYLGSLLLERRKIDDAATAAERALALAPQNSDVVKLMGRVAFERGDLAAAEIHFRRALALRPDLADALNDLGNVLKYLGKLDEARTAYRQALALDPAATGIYVNYADSVTFSADDPHLRAMEAMREGSAPLSDTDRLQLDFALAKAYADLKDHGRSFERLLSGNALKRAQIQYDEAAALAFFERLAATFTATLLREKASLGGGNPTPVPIFIFGMPRSGTTLVEHILASHPDVHGAGELNLLNEVVGDVRAPDGTPIPYPEFVPNLDAVALDRIGTRYVAEIRKLAPDAPRITDKLPSNYYYAGLIHLALPNARIIHTLRDPIDNCVSCFSKLFTAEQNHTYDLVELGRYYRYYRKLMAHWQNVLPQGTILDVRYEDVVSDLEGQARRIVAHCGLTWNPQCLTFHTTDRPVRTASASQVRQPIYDSAIGRAHAFEAYLGPLKNAMGGV